jgi:hypothetical protein
MPAPVYSAWKNYEKARKPGGLNYSTFKYRYLDGKKEHAKSPNKIQQKNQEFYLIWGGPQIDFSMPNEKPTGNWDSSAPITSGRYEGEEIRYRGNPSYESQMRRTKKYGNP